MSCYEWATFFSVFFVLFLKNLCQQKNDSAFVSWFHDLCTIQRYIKNMYRYLPVYHSINKKCVFSFQESNWKISKKQYSSYLSLFSNAQLTIHFRFSVFISTHPSSSVHSFIYICSCIELYLYIYTLYILMALCTAWSLC